MLKYFFSKINLLLVLLLFSSCSKDDSSVNTSSLENRLIGEWHLKKTIVQELGQPESTFYPSTNFNCYMNFKKDNSHFLDQSSPVFSNTKLVEDHKDCTWQLNAWKINKDGKLLLASMDTVYADVLKLSNDSLILKMDIDNYYGPENNHYQAEMTYYLTR